MFELTVVLLSAHFLADFLFLSPDRYWQRQNDAILLRHSLTAAVLAYLIAARWFLWPIPALAFVIHLAVDVAGRRFPKRTPQRFLAEQCAHVVLALLAARLLVWILVHTLGAPGPRDEFPPTLWAKMLGGEYYRLIILLAGAVVVVRGSGILVKAFLQQFVDQVKRDAEGQSELTHPGTPAGGKTIGELERAMIFVLILAQQPLGIGFLLAAKSIFRFGDLTDPKRRIESEYIIIGTFLSFLCALAGSYLTVLFTKPL